MHQPSDVIVLVDLVGTLSQSQKYLRIQSDVPVVLFGVIGLNDETSKQLDQSEQKTCTLQVMPLLLLTNSTISFTLSGIVAHFAGSNGELASYNIYI